MKSPRVRETQLVGLWCEPVLLEKLDAARGYKGRSQFCREALRELLGKMGYDVAEKDIMPRDTVGRPRKRVKAASPSPALNEPATLYRVTEPAVPMAEKPPAVPPVKPSKKKPQTPTP